MVEETDLVEDFHHDTEVVALGEIATGDTGMDEGHAEDDRPPTIAANLVEVPNPGSDVTIHGNFGMVEETEVVEEVQHNIGVPDLGVNVRASSTTTRVMRRKITNPLLRFKKKM